MYIKTYFKETPEGQYKAEIQQGTTGFFVEYWKPTGEKFKTEHYAGQSIHYVQDSVENWIDSIKTLNG